jgi:hypothetical protein
MKKMYVMAGFLLASGAAFAQHDLFFSEYVEGSGQALENKAIEVYNPTTSPVPIGQYSIRRYSNGGGNGTTFTGAFQEEILQYDNSAAGAFLNPADVFVYANMASNAACILSAADQLDALYASSDPTVLVQGGAAKWNGNDAVALVRWENGLPGAPGAIPIVVDIFGVIGNDPGFQWITTTIVGPDTFQVSSANHSLKRKDNICQGIMINPDPATYEIGDQWVSYSDAYHPDFLAQDFCDLGSHVIDLTACPPGQYLSASQVELFSNSIQLGPNPATDFVNVTLSAEHRVNKIELMNTIGQQIVARPATGAQQVQLNTSSLAPGLYFLKFTSQDNQTVYKELIVQ